MPQVPLNNLAGGELQEGKKAKMVIDDYSFFPFSLTVLNPCFCFKSYCTVGGVYLSLYHLPHELPKNVRTILIIFII